MEKCYEFLFCEKEDCVRRTIDELQCWEIEGTSCYDHSDIFVNYQALISDKADACSQCTYYKIYHNKA